MRAPIEDVRVHAFRVPTDEPEQDGTLSWDSTTLVVVEMSAGGKQGIGYTYASAAAGRVIDDLLVDPLKQGDAFDIPGIWSALVRAVRNAGRPGIASCAISCVDGALWDLKAKLIGLSLARLLGAARSDVPIYGSGGFTSYTDGRLAEQLSGWVANEGCTCVKMKIGRDMMRDRERIAVARRAIGEAELYVDANGAFTVKQALAFAEQCRGDGITWFEEPVSSDDLVGLKLVRGRVPGGMKVAAGEYGYDDRYFLQMLSTEAVDVLQADATRCGGITGFLKAATLADAHGLPLSAHTAPALHVHVAAAAPRLMNVEWFHDHVRIERMLFDGAPVPRQGTIRPDLDRPGLGLTLKRQDAQRFAI
ncbi:MAG: enolase C-terminal domain-like protein [Pseudomonadota bacterium]